MPSANAELSAATSSSPARLAWARLQRDRLAMAGIAVLALLGLAALFGWLATSASSPWAVASLDPATVRLTDKLAAPMSAASALVSESERPFLGVYLMGTDELGRDVFARMLQGAPVSLLIGFVAVGIALVVGVLVGALAGYFAERTVLGLSIDTVLMRLTDAMLCFPTFFLILTVVALLPASIYNIMVVIGLTSWMSTARFVRAEVLSLRNRDFVAAARALGLGPARIIWAHVLPNTMSPVLVTATIGVATAILTESALSFLGFGVQPPDATWGNILADGKVFIFDAPWLFFIPGFAILAVVLAFNLVGEGLREALDPRLRHLREAAPAAIRTVRASGRKRTAMADGSSTAGQ
ncbi:MAG: ABC transporter permease [Pseudomonadota bacterium]